MSQLRTLVIVLSCCLGAGRVAAQEGETPVAAPQTDAWRTARPALYETWRRERQEEWDLRLKNALVNFRECATDTGWTADELTGIADSLERAIRLGVPPDLALTFAQRCVQWRFAAEESRGILDALSLAIRSDGKCAAIRDLLDDTFQSNYRGRDLVMALGHEINKRRRFEEGLIPQEERRALERKQAEEATRREEERKAVENRGKPEEKKKDDKPSRH